MPRETPGEMAGRIRYWRERAKLSRAELAKVLGLDESAVRHWECGDNGPRDLAGLASACGVSLSRFWGPLPTGRRQAAG